MKPLTWVQPEDLLLHEFVQSRAEGRDVEAIERQWLAAVGGSLVPPVGGASEHPAAPGHRELADRLLDELDRLPSAEDAGHPDRLADVEAGWRPEPTIGPADDRSARLRGAWTGRAAGCLLGKPVEKIPRAGVRAIAEDTGNWPVAGYFTAAGLRPETAASYPWNRRSAATSLVENIDGMPEDDDLNYPLLNLALLERVGDTFDTDDVALAWLDNLPAGRVFTAERVVYRNLLLALPPERTARRRNPFREWIGAVIRGDVFGWVRPGDPQGAARLAWRDARLSHTRNGVYGELWAAALAAASLTAADVGEVLTSAAQVVPAASDLADAIGFGTELGRRTADLDLALDALHQRYGHLHWVHVLNNAATIAWALSRSGGDFGRGSARR